MKRMLVRLSLLTSVVVLGLIAIAQAQRGINNPNLPPSEAGTATGSPGLNDDAPGPITPRPETSVRVVSDAADDATGGFGTDPFARRSGDVPPAHDQSEGRSAPPVVNPLAAELNVGALHATNDDFPSAGEALGMERDRLAADPQPRQASGDPSGDADLLLAQASGAVEDASSKRPTPAPPSTLPRQAPPTGARQPYNPIRTFGDENKPPATQPPTTQPPATPPPATPPSGDRYGRPIPNNSPDSALPVGAPLASRPGHASDPARATRGTPVEPTRGGTPEQLAIDNSREGTGIPGAKQLEGQQVPNLLLHKAAPEEIQVGRPAVFEIRVRNTGTVPVHGVEIHDTLPKGTRLMATTPLASSGPQGALIWEIGTLEPGDETTVGVQLMPISEGEIGSVASVRFSTEVSVTTIATKPELIVEVDMADSVMIGESIALNIRITNPGSGVATNVIMEELVPDLFEHVKGSALEYEIGDLKPNETREVPLTLTALQAGLAMNVLQVRADGNLFDDARNEVHVVAPAIEVHLEGPKRRFLDREATYNVTVNNSGTATAREIELVTYLPPGMDFVNANNQGQYDPATRAVYWLLDELPPAETGTVTLTALPTEAGLQKLRVEGTAQQGLSDQVERDIVVEGVAAIMFQVVDVEDPIEAGGETAYEIRVVNQGSKAATNVIIEAILPSEMKPLVADGPTRHKLDGQRVLFDPLPRLAPKADTTYLIRAQALKAGDLRLMVRLRTDDMQSPVTKEESTRVFSDE